MSAEPPSREETPQAPTSSRPIITPEGVALEMHVAGTFARAMAFAIDMGVILMALCALWLLALLGDQLLWEGVSAIALTLGLFVLRNFYFTFFELRWRGRTPGKRLMGLRVVDARGGALSAAAIFVRNLTRELELFLPLVVLFVPGTFWPNAPWAAQFFAASWALVLLIMPWLNRDRLRVGDLIAGTMVVSTPRLYLRHFMYEDLAAAQRTAVYVFTAEQLDMYGIYEMQVLENLLRQSPGTSAMHAVAQTITQKIAFMDIRWQADPGQFLRDFYAALRARREQRLLFGERQENKKMGSLQAPSSPPTQPR